MRIGVTERMGFLLLPQVLERFRKKYPNIQLDIVEKGGVDLVPEIYAKAYDCGDRLQYYRIENCPVTWKWAVVFSSDPQNQTRPSKELYKILSLIHFPV